MSQSDPGFRSGFFYQVGLAVPCTRSTKYMAYNIGCHSCSLFYLYCLLSVDASEHLVCTSYWIRETRDTVDCVRSTRIGSSNQLF